MATGKEILTTACKELGYHEGKGKDNKYGKWYGMNNVAWCMEFVQWVYAQAGAKLPYKTASCSALLNWYRANQPECVVEKPVPGCLVIFDLPNTGCLTDHVGIYESEDGGYITTIDGNTSSRNDANGGYVNRRTRRRNLVHAYIRPRELVNEPQKIKEDDEMDVSKLTNEQCYEILLKANEYAASLATPEWMKAELQEAVDAGITDGSRPLAMVQRGAAAIMAKRVKNSC